MICRVSVSILFRPIWKSQGIHRVAKNVKKPGSEWVHLRLCLTCGHVGCCDASRNKHGTKHFKDTMHPVIKSFEPGESWKWCFVDEIFAE